MKEIITQGNELNKEDKGSVESILRCVHCDKQLLKGDEYNRYEDYTGDKAKKLE